MDRTTLSLRIGVKNTSIENKTLEEGLLMSAYSKSASKILYNNIRYVIKSLFYFPKVKV